MAIDLLKITPHKVSTDLSGYKTYIYGPGGAGKTTFGVSAVKPLLLAFEKGYNALPGVYAQDITSWGEFKMVVRSLKEKDVKEFYKTIVIDTIDIASALCEKYICDQLNIDNIGDGGWKTNGWSKVKKEWETVFRSIEQEGYAIIFLSHSKDKTFTRKDGSTYNQIVPSCPSVYNEIIRNMADIEGYISVTEGDRQLILRSADDSIECKSRFAMMAPVIPFSHNDLDAALRDAIEKEASAKDNKFVTTERAVNTVVSTTYDYTSLMDEFQSLVGKIMETNQTTNGPKITQIIESFLGKGKKVSDATTEQAEFIYLINESLKDTFKV